MARILFMTSVYRYEDKGNLNVDLIDEFIAQGHHVDVMTPVERRHRSKVRVSEFDRLRVVEFPCLNFRGEVNLLEKGLSTLTLGYLYRYFMRRHSSDRPYDLAIYTTLPTTYGPAIRLLKKRHGTFCYLLHKDIFPQSAVDLGLLREGSLPYSVFRGIEQELYRCSDAVGVMSEKNACYVREHNPAIDPAKVEVCPNSILPFDRSRCDELRADRSIIRERYGIPLGSVVYIYGGNISRAQGIDFVIAVAERFDECPNSYLLFVGSGNEMGKLRSAVSARRLENVGIVDHLDKEEFDRLAAACDVGLVFLDHRFTIANIPSRALAHLNLSQPILAATDEFTDFRDLIREWEMGLWSPSGDVSRFLENVRVISADERLRRQLGVNARTYLESEASVKRTHAIITAHLSAHEVVPVHPAIRAPEDTCKGA